MLAGLETAEIVTYTTYDGRQKGEASFPTVIFDRAFNKSLRITPVLSDDKRSVIYLSCELTIDGILSRD